MAIFSERARMLYELKVNGKDVEDENDDFSIDDEEEGANKAPSTTDTNEPAPAVDDTPEGENANAVEDEGADDEEDNYTLEDDDDGDMDDTTNDEASDNDDTAEDDGEDDDFTMEDNGEEGGDTKGEDAGSDEENDDKSETSDQSSSNDTETSSKNPTDSIANDEDRASEEAIYDSLTDDQKRIRVLQLKLNYKDLYETILTTIESVNQIPKTTQNIETLKRLNFLLVRSKTILVSYIENNFDQNPYMENYTIYLKYIAIFRTVAKVIEEINENK